MKNQDFATKYKHIFTKDLRIIENSKLGKLLTQSLHYRETKTIHFSSMILSKHIEKLIKHYKPASNKLIQKLN